MKMEFKVIVCSYSHELEKESNELSESGFSPVGAVIFANHKFIQQWSKYEEFIPEPIPELENDIKGKYIADLPTENDAMKEIGNLLEEMQAGQLKGMMVMHAILTDKINEFVDEDAAIEKAIEFVKKIEKKLKESK